MSPDGLETLESLSALSLYTLGPDAERAACLFGKDPEVSCAISFGAVARGPCGEEPALVPARTPHKRSTQVAAMSTR
jgi:hypothetical protein